jgi:hypothetical protein
MLDTFSLALSSSNHAHKVIETKLNISTAVIAGSRLYCSL